MKLKDVLENHIPPIAIEYRTKTLFPGKEDMMVGRCIYTLI